MVEWLEGTVSRLIWASDSDGYAVCKILTADGSEVVAVGDLAVLVEQGVGAFAALEGRWEEHTVHGRQFRADGFLQGSPRSLEGMRLYLSSSGIRGVGPALAQRIVNAFGIRVPAVLQDEAGRLSEVPGIGPVRAAAIRDAWKRDEEGRALTITLRGLGLSPRLIQRIRSRYGTRTAQVVAREPYRLTREIRGVGFRTADALALGQGLAVDAPARVGAAILHVVERSAMDGHCYVPRFEAVRAVADLGVPIEGVDEAISTAERAGHLVLEPGEDRPDDRIFGARLYLAEQAVAGEMHQHIQGQMSLLAEDIRVNLTEEQDAIRLDEHQERAVGLALAGGIIVVTGGPGTGKTTLVRALMNVARRRGENWLLASPTGRASRRLKESTGMPASTLHRLLEYAPATGLFQRNRANPLSCDGLVVDEVSMVDVVLMEALLAALPVDEDKFSLVLMGDADQLPSVGPGQVLRDSIASGVVPVCRLSTVYRQEEGSGIVAAARAVLRGRLPVSGERGGADDFYFVERDDATAASHTIVSIVAERLQARGFCPVDDVQVLTPTRRGVLGAQDLNRALQERLNPGQGGLEIAGRCFRSGDRVQCIRNRYDVGVFNGDTGRILEAGHTGLTVAFDGNTIEWDREDLSLLELAYAVTVHKSQGSEYPAVVLVLHPSHGLLLRRNLMYTAITRARRFCCVVGSVRAVRRCVGETRSEQRNTRLATRLAATRSHGLRSTNLDTT